MIEKWREGETITAAKLNKVSKSILDSIQAGSGIAIRRQATGIMISNTQKKGKSESSESPSPMTVVKITADIPDDENEHYQKGWYLGKVQKLSSDGTEWENESDTEILVIFDVYYMSAPASALTDGVHLAYNTEQTRYIGGNSYSIYHVIVNMPGKFYIQSSYYDNSN